MSLAELKENAVTLTPEERLELAAFLAELDERDSGAFSATVNRRMAEMDSGKKVGMEDFETAHQRLKSQGK